MSAINNLSYYINLLITACMIAIAILGGLAFYLLKVKKVMAREEKIDYSTFERRDSTEFTKFDNVINCKMGNGGQEFGVIVVDDTHFIGVLDIKGYNFSSASLEERQRTIINSVSFFNTVERPIQMRQSVKAIDLTYNIEQHTAVCKALERKQIDLEYEYNETLSLLDTVEGSEMYDVVSKKLKELQRTIVTTRWEYEEAKEVLSYLKGITSSSNARKINQLVFSYTFNPEEYTEELTHDEIYLKACSELAILANNYTMLLGNCGCTCKLMNGKEILDLIRRHNHPFTADDIKIEELLNSSIDALFVSSDSLLKSERQRLGQKRYDEMLNVMNQNAKNSYAATKTKAEDFAEGLERSVRNYVYNEQTQGV